MNKVKVVTGYVPIKDHPRTVQEYGMLGEKLRNLKVPVQPFYGAITSMWMYSMMEALPFAPTWSVGDNPQKNTLPYHCVNHQKFQWLYEASKLDQDSDTFVWIDYGIMHVPGVTAAVINEFLDRVAKKPARHVISIPGCWPKGEVDDANPCWRFCGGLLVVPREYVQPLNNLIKAVTMLHVRVTKNITWEVNTLARAEQTGKLPFRWYAADHNQSMFENY
jgi:hypothetical protein